MCSECQWHGSSVIFHNDTFRAVDYYKILNFHVRSEAQYFVRNAVFQEEGTPTISLAVRSLRMKYFWIVELKDTVHTG